MFSLERLCPSPYSLVLADPYLDHKFCFCFHFPPSWQIGLCGVVWVGRGEGIGQFLSLREAYISNLSFLLCLEALEKFLVGWVGCWSRPILGFSFSQAEQQSCMLIRTQLYDHYYSCKHMWRDLTWHAVTQMFTQRWCTTRNKCKFGNIKANDINYIARNIPTFIVDYLLILCQKICSKYVTVYPAWVAYTCIQMLEGGHWALEHWYMPLRPKLRISEPNWPKII